MGMEGGAEAEGEGEGKGEEAAEEEALEQEDVASVPRGGQSGSLPAGWKRVARVSSNGKQYFRFQGPGGLKAQSRPEAWRLSKYGNGLSKYGLSLSKYGSATSPAAAEPNHGEEEEGKEQADAEAEEVEE